MGAMNRKITLLIIGLLILATVLFIGCLEREVTPSAPTPMPTPTPTPTPIPTLESPLEGSLVSSLTPTLKWKPVTEATSYGLQVGTDYNFINRVIDQTGLSGNSYDVPSDKLSYSKIYYWRVNATSEEGTTTWSMRQYFRTPPGPQWPAGATPRSIIGLHTTKGIGEQSVITILVDFADVKHTVSQEAIHNKVFIELDDYIREVSYNQTRLVGNTTTWYQLPNPISHYSISPRNLEVDRTRVWTLVSDALNAADNDIDFSEYSHVIIVLGARYPEYGMIGYCALPGMLGREVERGITTRSGETVHGVAVYCEDALLGTFAHDMIHVLGGVMEGRRVVPCLYDHELQATPGSFRGYAQFFMVYMGFWDPMSCHNYKRRAPGISSWTKMRLGWIDPSKTALINPGHTTSIRLDPLELPTSDTLVIKIPLTSDTYYLIENRQKIGFDENLPSSGVLILYADDRVAECHGDSPVRLIDANPDVYWLLDAAFDIGENDIFIDSKNGLAIILLQKIDLSYEIHITTSEKVDIASKSWGIIKEASSDVDKALIEGRLDKAQQLLGQAAVAFDKGNYDEAKNLAQKAKES